MNGSVFPKTVAEAVDMILAELPADEGRRIGNMDEVDLYSLHHVLGRQVRNRFGLWGRNEPLIEDCRRIDGCSPSATMHPDDASHIILLALHAKLGGKDVCETLATVGQCDVERPMPAFTCDACGDLWCVYWGDGPYIYGFQDQVMAERLVDALNKRLASLDR